MRHTAVAFEYLGLQGEFDYRKPYRGQSKVFVYTRMPDRIRNVLFPTAVANPADTGNSSGP